VAYYAVAEPMRESWVFARSRYTHDPDTGARVAQYDQIAPVEPLPDQRIVTSGYRRTRSTLLGADGSADSTYQVQSYGNGRGGLDAEWERFHDAWRGSTIAGGAFNYAGGGGFGFPPYGGYPGYGAPGVGPGYGPGYGPGFPGGIYPPGYGYDPRLRGPDPRRLDPDAADGYHDGTRRTRDDRFFRYGTPNGEDLPTP
jgi:hypothetical protein